MTVVINGEETVIANDLAVSGLIDFLGLKPERLAIEVNNKIIRRSEWNSTLLSEGDKIEIVHFVGGGSVQLSAISLQPSATDDQSKVSNHRSHRFLRYFP
ncbi:MAG: sulfur carrier protein ThiS [Blastocatellia bacterium]|nr:sulfur carrier protein ThiS [Blastocatellia bacterium]